MGATHHALIDDRSLIEIRGGIVGRRSDQFTPRS